VPIVLYAADEWGGVGGTAGYILMVARDVCRRGYRVVAICDAADQVAPLRAALAGMGVDVRTDPRRDARSFVGRLGRYRWYVELFREFRHGVMLMLMGYHTRGGNAIVAARLAGMRAIVRADLTPPEPPIGGREQFALRFKDLWLDRVVVGAHENIEAFGREMRRNTRKMRVIHTGIELARWQPDVGRDAIRSELDFGPETLVVGTLSRLDDERKGVNYFVEMAAHVAREFEHARFLIVGDGILRQSLEDQASALGVRDRVVFAGWRTDVPQLIAAMDVFVMQSTFEGGPTTVLEAMAAQRPVVATRVGMVPEVVKDGETGLIVPIRDGSALADAVGKLLSDSELRERIARRARECALQNFSIQQMVDRYLELAAEVYQAAAVAGARRATR